MEKYLGGKEISKEEIRKAVREATINGKFIPVFCSSALKNKGSALLDAVLDYLPSPLDLEHLSRLKLNVKMVNYSSAR